jgi:hypothetical protein
MFTICSISEKAIPSAEAVNGSDDGPRKPYAPGPVMAADIVVDCVSRD